MCALERSLCVIAGKFRKWSKGAIPERRSDGRTKKPSPVEAGPTSAERQHGLAVLTVRGKPLGQKFILKARERFRLCDSKQGKRNPYQ